VLKDKLKSFCLQNSIGICLDDFDHAAALDVLFPPSNRYSYDRSSLDRAVLSKCQEYVNICPFEVTVPSLQGRVWVGSSSGSLCLSPVDLEIFTNMPVGSFRVYLSGSLDEGDHYTYGRNYSPDMLDRDDFAETVIEDAQALIDSVKSRIEFFSDRPEGASIDCRSPSFMRLGRVLHVRLGWYWVHAKKEGA